MNSHFYCYKFLLLWLKIFVEIQSDFYFTHDVILRGSMLIEFDKHENWNFSENCRDFERVTKTELKLSRLLPFLYVCIWHENKFPHEKFSGNEQTTLVRTSNVFTLWKVFSWRQMLEIWSIWCRSWHSPHFLIHLLIIDH